MVVERGKRSNAARKEKNLTKQFSLFKDMVKKYLPNHIVTIVLWLKLFDGQNRNNWLVCLNYWIWEPCQVPDSKWNPQCATALTQFPVCWFARRQLDTQPGGEAWGAMVRFLLWIRNMGNTRVTAFTKQHWWERQVNAGIFSNQYKVFNHVCTHVHTHTYIYTHNIYKLIWMNKSCPFWYLYGIFMFHTRQMEQTWCHI